MDIPDYFFQYNKLYYHILMEKLRYNKNNHYIYTFPLFSHFQDFYQVLMNKLLKYISFHQLNEYQKHLSEEHNDALNFPLNKDLASVSHFVKIDLLFDIL